MKIEVSEKQFKKIMDSVNKSVDIKEQGEETQSGTSTQQGGAQGYPSVGKWESGVTRGPANQIGITKWSDVVGSVLKRGKANPLK